MSNILVTNPEDNYAEVLFADGRRLAIKHQTSFSKYAAEVALQGPISGVFDGEFDLRDEVKLFEGTLPECYNHLVWLAGEKFDVIEIPQIVGTAKQKCAKCQKIYAEYGEDLCQFCINQVVAPEAGIPF